MSKNITIQEGSVAKQLTVDKLKTNLVGGGTCLWLPEDEVLLGQKTINANGTYKASDDGLYGYSQVTVSNAGIASGTIPSGATLPTGDGNEYSVTTDNNGNLDFLKIPSSIQITTQPTTTEYYDGDTIDFTGMVVTMYDANGQSMGTISLSELILPITEADDGSAYHDEWSDGAGVNALMVTYTQRWWLDPYGNEKTTYCSEPVGTRDGLPVMYGDSTGPTQFFITKYNGYTYCMGSTASRHLYGYTYDASAPYNNYSLFHSTSFTTGIGQVVNAAYVDEWATAVPESTVEPTGTENLHPMSGVQTIPVKWARTGDGKVLETSFEITVTDVY